MMSVRRHTILVVDDEPDIIDSVKDLLRLEYDVLGATRARDALRLLGERGVDVVMTDQRMPEMSGVALLHEVREAYPDVTRLLFTGYADLRAVVDAINQGSVYRYVTKPWDPVELQSVIREACERHDLLVDRKRLIAELETRNAELARADALKTTFIRTVGHELRTPLTLQLGLARLARRSESLTLAQARDWLARIERSAERLHARAEQLLTLLYSEHFATTLERAPADLGEVLRDAAEGLRPFVERRNQTLTVRVASDLGVASLDRAKIDDAIQQLLLNAIKFTPDGGEITLSGDRVGASVVVAVADGGPGIPVGAMPYLFQPFFTGLDSDRHSSGLYEHGARGMGLGLSVARALVEMHGGTVTARNEPGGGAVLTITLPAP
jgi:signal transduction histidine kinase